MKYFPELEPDDKEAKELRAKYRSVFLQGIGKDVLADILIELCGFGDYQKISEPEAIGQYNVGVAILAKIGCLSTDSDKEALINAIAGINITEDKK